MPILFLIVFIDLVGFGVIIPLLPFYGVHFGATPTEVTWMMACYSLAQFFVSPILGRLSDRVGRRPVLLVSLVGSVASYLWLGLRRRAVDAVRGAAAVGRRRRQHRGGAGLYHRRDAAREAAPRAWA